MSKIGPNTLVTRRECLVCGKEFWVRPSRIKYGAKYCSRECQRSVVLPSARGKAGWDPAVRAKISATLMGPTHATRGKHISQEQIEKIRLSNIGKNAGERNAHWRGGITPFNKALRNATEYRKFRREVIARDGRFCSKCGDECVGHKECHVHHVKEFKDNPELRHDPMNGIVLCRSCHLALHWASDGKDILAAVA